jgi:hypothetical protein
LAGGAVFAGSLEALGVLQVNWVKRERQYLLARGDGISGEGEEGHSKPAGEGVGRDAEDGDVVRWVGGDDGGWEYAGWGIGSTEDEVGPAAVAESIENVGVGEQVAFLVDEEGVTEEDVVVAARGGGFVEAVDHRADGGVGRQGHGWTVGGQSYAISADG